MTATTVSLVTNPSDREVMFSRTFAAPRELVWQAWSDPAHLHQWFGPTGFTTTTHEFAFVPGGVWRFIMHGPDGTDYPNRIVFREIDPPRLLMYENGWDLPGAPLDFTVRASFEALETGTRLVLHFVFVSVDAYRTAVERYGVVEGGKQTMERIAEYVERQTD